MEKLLLIDGNSILNRAYYGIRPLTAPDGTLALKASRQTQGA